MYEDCKDATYNLQIENNVQIFLFRKIEIKKILINVYIHKNYNKELRLPKFE